MNVICGECYWNSKNSEPEYEVDHHHLIEHNFCEVHENGYPNKTKCRQFADAECDGGTK